MAKNYYDGAAPCAGCGRPGTLVTRLTKDCLCSECKRRLELGGLVEKDLTVSSFNTIEEFVRAQLPTRFTWNSSIEYAMIDFFKAFNCPSEIYAGGLKRIPRGPWYLCIEFLPSAETPTFWIKAEEMLSIVGDPKKHQIVVMFPSGGQTYNNVDRYSFVQMSQMGDWLIAENEDL